WITISGRTVTAAPGMDITPGEYPVRLTGTINGDTQTENTAILTVRVVQANNTIDLKFLTDTITMSVEQAGKAEKTNYNGVDYGCTYKYSNGRSTRLAPTFTIEDAPSWLMVENSVIMAKPTNWDIAQGEYTATLKATVTRDGITATATAKIIVTVTGYTELKVTAPDSSLTAYPGGSVSTLALSPLITVQGHHSVRGWETIDIASKEFTKVGNWPSWLTITGSQQSARANPPAGTTPGKYDYEYSVTVTKGNLYGTGKCKLTVYVSENSTAEPAKFTMNTDTLPDATLGVAYSAKITATGDAPIKWELEWPGWNPLHEGLTLNEDTGEISGIPTETGRKRFRVYVSNAANSKPDEKEFFITVNGVPPSDWKVSRSPTKVKKGETFDITFRVKKGSDVYYNTMEKPDSEYVKKVTTQNSNEQGSGYIKYTCVWPEKKETKYKFKVKAFNKFGTAIKTLTVKVYSSGKVASFGDDDIDYGFITLAEDDDEDSETSETYPEGYTPEETENEDGVEYFSDGGTDSDGNITGVIGGTNAKFTTLSAFINSLTGEQRAKVIRLEFRSRAEVSKITASDIAALTNLSEIAIDECGSLTEIDLAGNKTIKSVSFFDCAVLEKLSVKNCEALSHIEAAKCPKLTGLEVEGCKSLETLWLNGSAITNLNLSGSEFANVSNIDVAGCSSLEVLNVDGCAALSDLYAPYTAITELNLKNNPELTDLFLNNTKVSTLDLSNNSKLKSLSLIGATNLTGLKLASGVNLEDFELGAVKITELDLAGSDIASLNLSTNPELTSLNLANCTNLRELNLSCTQIASLNIAGCYSLVSLDVSNCIELTSLKAKGFSLEYLNVTGCTKLAELDCSDNYLGYLNLDDLTALSTVNYSGQKINNWTPSTKLKFSDFIANNSVARVVEIFAYDSNGDGMDSKIEEENGNVYTADDEYYAVFASVPEKVVYYYDTYFDDGEPMD
ncbi:MAG: hypothetical protein IJ597_02010, partial [Synergistaceae bacterium]|nr:hypothetical protein [Synergistaceae bacterium]